MLRGKKEHVSNSMSPSLKAKPQKFNTQKQSNELSFEKIYKGKKSNLQVIQSKIYVSKHIKERTPDFKEFYRLKTQVRKNILGKKL